jgi:hypothetical protein
MTLEIIIFGLVSATDTNGVSKTKYSQVMINLNIGIDLRVPC